MRIPCIAFAVAAFSLAAIPVLEKTLKDAKVDLPPRN